MLKYFPMLLLAAAIGCTQGSDPAPVPVASAITDTTTTEPTVEETLDLPDETATTIEFYCPGMT